MKKEIKGRRLNFINAYFGVRPDGSRCQSYNATLAAKIAGYSPKSAANQGSRLLRKDIQVAAEIKRIRDELCMSPEEVLNRMSDQARGDIAELIDESGRIKLKELKGRGHLIHKYKIEERQSPDGTITTQSTLEFYNSQTALKNMGQYHNLWKRQADIKLDIESIGRGVENLFQSTTIQGEIDDIVSEMKDEDRQ